MAQTLGFDLVEVGDGFAAFAESLSEALLNPMGTIHGGWALKMVDSATGCAALSLQPPGSGFTTIETELNFSCPSSRTAASCAPKRASSPPDDASFPRKRE